MRYRTDIKTQADKEIKTLTFWWSFRHEMELDYLAPFLAQLGDPPTLTKMQASKLKSDCLADLKQRLIDKANLIQV